MLRDFGKTMASGFLSAPRAYLFTLAFWIGLILLLRHTPVFWEIAQGNELLTALAFVVIYPPAIAVICWMDGRRVQARAGARSADAGGRAFGD